MQAKEYYQSIIKVSSNKINEANTIIIYKSIDILLNLLLFISFPYAFIYKYKYIDCFSWISLLFVFIALLL